MTSVACNICGCDRFVDARKSKGTICANCGSSERARVVKLFLDRHDMFRPGIKVAHFAPEECLARLFLNLDDVDYQAYDLNPRRYSFVETKPFNLCTDIYDLPSNYYDVIIHNHVVEHLPCNYTMTLLHLHRALSPTGLHLFSFPTSAGGYEEDISDISREERLARFNQGGHVRRFGRDSMSKTIGMIFNIPDPYRLDAHFSEEMLTSINIRKKYNIHTGASALCLRKDDLRL